MRSQGCFVFSVLFVRVSASFLYHIQGSPPGSAQGSGARTKPKHPISDCLWANKMYLVVVKTMLLLVRSSRSGVWGGALPGTVRSLAVVVENRR